MIAPLTTLLALDGADVVGFLLAWLALTAVTCLAIGTAYRRLTDPGDHDR